MSWEGGGTSTSRRGVLRLLGGAGGAAALAGGLTACGAPAGPAGGATTPGPGAAAKQTQFTYTARIGVQADHFDAFAQQFTQQHPNIKYVPQHVPGNEWAQKIQVQAAGGTLSDAIWMPSIGLFGQFAHKGILADHSPLARTQRVDLKVFYPAAVDGLTREGKLYGIPWIVHPGRTGLYYNQALFDAAGAKYPDEKWTYQDLAAAAAALTKRSGDRVDQFGSLPGSDMFNYIIPIRAYGGDYLSPDGKKLTIDTPQATQAIQEAVADMVSKLKVAPTPDLVEGGAPQMFASKKLALFQSGYWGASGLYQYAKDVPWGVTPMPLQPGGKLGMFEIDTNSVTRFAKDPDSAFLFCVFMGSKEAGIDIAKRGSVPGGRPDVWEAPELMQLPNHAVFAKILASCPGLLLPANFRDDELSTAFGKGFDDVTFGREAQAATVIKALTPSLQAILDKPAD